MNVRFVTAIVLPKSGEPYRPLSVYVEHFTHLVDAGVPLSVFVDERIQEPLPTAPHVDIHPTSMDSWWKDGELPTFRNLEKDTSSYMSIQYQKLRWVSEATALYPAQYFAWIDFGVFHMFDDPQVAKEKLRALASRDTFPTTSTILTPGCWPVTNYPVWDAICWRFCGTFFIGHRDVFPKAWDRQNAIIDANAPRLTWEVNIWTLMEDIMTWYLASHNDLLLSVPS